MSKRWIVWSFVLMGLPWLDGAGDKPVGVCEAVNRPSQARVSITGLAQLTKEGLIMGDLACPVFRFHKVAIPAAVIVHVSSFGSDQVKVRFSAIKPGLDSPRLRVVVHGTIECQPALRFDVSDDGQDVTGGNGYGLHGFYKCKIEDGSLESLERITNR
jgi:hypothetical protein